MEAIANPDEGVRRFQDALKQVMSVSKDDLKEALEKEKFANEGKPKRGPKPKHL
jgi:hypothetical protein